MEISFGKENTKFIAHRGFSSVETENTNAAFVAAGNRGYWGIETDVRRTADGYFVLMHDNTTRRVAEENLNIEQSTWAKLQSLTLKDKSGRVRSDLKIPQLHEYIKICKTYQKIAVLELKSRLQDSDIVAIIKIIQAEEYLSHTIFISFLLENLLSVREEFPKQRVQLLTDTYSPELLDKLVAYRMDVDIYYPILTQNIVWKLKEHGITVNCWTCDKAEAMKKLIDYGVDYITTNRLPLELPIGK